MPIPVTCSCGKKYQAKDEHAGRKLKCPACGEVVPVPQAPVQQASVRPPVVERTPAQEPAAQEPAAQVPATERVATSQHQFAENPYQPPQGAEPVYSAEVVDESIMWREGNLLVLHKNATFPPVCVKSNTPTKRTLKRDLSWHHPAVFLSILISVLIYIVLALVLRKTATIHIGLSDQWFAKRRRAMLVGWVSVLLSIGLFVVGIAALDTTDHAGWLLFFAVLLFFFGAIYGLIGARMVSATRITDDYVWLKGVHPQFLEKLEPWPNHP